MTTTADTVMLPKVRLSFPHIFEPAVFQGVTGKYGGTFLLHKQTHAALIQEISQRIADLCTARFKGQRLPPDRICFRDGDAYRDEYYGCMSLSAHNRRRPTVIDDTGCGVIASETDSPLYAGCFVNAKINFWVQDNQWGRRINANLIAVQFDSHGEPFEAGMTPVDAAMDGFGSVAPAGIPTAGAASGAAVTGAPDPLGLDPLGFDDDIPF